MKKCNIQDVCGGCTLLHLSYDEQLKLKYDNEVTLLNRFGKVEPVLGMVNPLHYRNKIELAGGMDDRGRTIFGNYVKGTHFVVPVSHCMLPHPLMNKIQKTIIDLIKQMKLTVYDERRHRGLFRHIMIRYSKKTNQAMVTLVTTNMFFERRNEFVNKLSKAHKEIKSIIQNINVEKTSKILGKKEILLYGEPYIEDILCDCKFLISSASFYQVNADQTEVLYNTALDMANLSKEDTILDAYCGIGTIGIIASKRVKEVISVELNPVAIEDAKKNARLNKVDNIKFYCDDAGKFMKKHCKDPIDVVIMDPPRAGADVPFMNSLFTLNPKKIIYISCNPKTLKDNLGYMTKHNYKVEKIQPVDMFPMTEHVETVCLMSRKEK